MPLLYRNAILVIFQKLEGFLFDSGRIRFFAHLQEFTLSADFTANLLLPELCGIIHVNKHVYRIGMTRKMRLKRDLGKRSLKRVYSNVICARQRVLVDDAVLLIIWFCISLQIYMPLAQCRQSN